MPDAMVESSASKTTGNGATQQVDVAVVGAGFAGLYLLHRLRKAGFTTVAVDEASDVGGTWYWNRYPGARCDIQTIDYSYTFDPELESAWKWSEKYATQPEILRYLGFVADRYDLRRDIRFHTKVTAATWDQAAERWRLTTDNGAAISCRYYIMATGCLSSPKPPEIEGVKDFKGEIYFTGRWPHHEVKLAGKRVAVIGTGSSGIQAIPLIAEQAAHLTVFQRTASFALPAHNGPASADRTALLQSDRAGYREQARWSMAGVPFPPAPVVSWQFSDAERRERFEQAWAAGDLVHILTQLWADQGVDVDGNALVAELIREKIRGDRQGPRDGGGAEPERPSVRFQASLPRYQLLRHLQPSQRHAGEPAAGADHRDHGLRHQDRQAHVRRRRHRVRHRLRRHDRRDHGGASDHRPWRKVAVRRLGRRPAELSRADRGRLPQSVHDHRPGQPVGAVEHGGVDRAACRLGGRPADGDARGRLHRDRGDRNGAGRLGATHGRLLDR